MAATREELQPLINNDVATSGEIGMERSITESAMHQAEAVRFNPNPVIAAENIVNTEGSSDLGAVGGAASNEEIFRYPECRLSKFSQSTASDEAIELARVAACNARKSANSCRVSMRSTTDAITDGKRKVDAALQAAENAGEDSDADHFMELSTRYSAAIDSISKMALSVGAAAENADVAAFEAEEAAVNLSDSRNEASAAAEQKLTTAYWAANTANAATIVAYKMEYVLLQLAKACWKSVEETEKSGSPKTNRRRMSKVNRPPSEDSNKGLFMWICHILALIAGGSMMASLPFVEYESIPFYVLLLFGLFLLAMFVAQLCYSVFMKDDKTASRPNVTRQNIQSINVRLDELKSYFDDNNITPEPSENSSESENN